MDKQLITLSTIEDGKDLKYTGRFLGFITDSEFNALIQHSEKVATKLESKATQPIMEVAAKFSEIIGHRLVMTVREVDNKSITKKMLFITGGLELIDSVVKGEGTVPGKVTFKSANDEIIEVQETE